MSMKCEEVQVAAERWRKDHVQVGGEADIRFEAQLIELGYMDPQDAIASIRGTITCVRVVFESGIVLELPV